MLSGIRRQHPWLLGVWDYFILIIGIVSVVKSVVFRGVLRSVHCCMPDMWGTVSHLGTVKLM